MWCETLMVKMGELRTLKCELEFEDGEENERSEPATAGLLGVACTERCHWEHLAAKLVD